LKNTSSALTNRFRQSDSELFSVLRKGAADAVLHEISMNIMRIASNESGRVVETAIQLLDESMFTALAAIVIGNETEEFVREFSYQIACLVANRIGMTVDLNPETIESIQLAALSILALINCENLRRKGYMEFSWPDSIFSSSPKDPGFTKLTAEGNKLAQDFTLTAFNSDGKASVQ
jgi:hypothetical protein